ncbi:GNAT family N-acetyltransferase [Paenibacillus azoreducens]|uniref:GNAT family N-acetyltransferase n=1 Tax=Paenibacillus azoreducens TaxID=116718 RepID=UPI0039F491A6
MSGNIIKSDQILLRRTQAEDLDFVLDTEAVEDSRRYVFTWPKEKHEFAMNNDDQLHIIIENMAGEKLGYIILAGLRNEHHCIELTRINMASKNKGYGKEAISLIQNYVFHKLQAHRLWLDVKEDNARARHVYESAGFTMEGTLRECIHTNGVYESLVIMGMLASEYKQRQMLER